MKYYIFPAFLILGLLATNSVKSESYLVSEELRVATACTLSKEDHVYDFNGQAFQLTAFDVRIEPGTRFVLRLSKLSELPVDELWLLYFAGTPSWQMIIHPEQQKFLRRLVSRSWELTEKAANVAGPKVLASCTAIGNLPPSLENYTQITT
jgi:hypothetical protein